MARANLAKCPHSGASISPASSFETSPNPQTGGVSNARVNGKGRGGARNLASRASHGLSRTQIANLLAAAPYADVIGLPINRMFSVHWKSAGVPLSEMCKATGHFIDLLTKTLARHGSGTAWLWVHENEGDKGWHCHLLAHVPADLVTTIAGKQKGWLRRITGERYRKDVIFSRPIGGRLGLEASNPELHAVNLDAALAYVLKGASPEAVSKFALKRLEPQGRVIGKRCGTSQNIGAKARKGGSQPSYTSKTSN